MERMIGGRIAKAKQGKLWTSSPPVGRAYDKKKEQWHVTDQGKVIAEVLRRYVEGENLKDVCSELGISSAVKISEWVWHGQLAGNYIAKFRSPEIDVEENVPVPGIPEVVDSTRLEKAKARLSHNRTFNRHDCRSYVLTGFVRCGDCERALTGQTNHDTIYYRHNDANNCSLWGIRGEDIEPVLDYLFNEFLDEPAFNEAVMKAMPPTSHRKSLLQERNRAEKRLAKNDREITRIVDAVVAGADPSLMVSKQDQLIAEKETLTKRLEELGTEIATLPSVEQTQQVASRIHFRLYLEHKGKNWRKLPYEQVKRFLFDLFGETTPKNGNGILVRRDERGNLIATFKGNVEFHHEIGNGRPISKAVTRAVDGANASIRMVYERGVRAADVERARANEEFERGVRAAEKELERADKEFERAVQAANDVVRPYPDDTSPDGT